jgi:hypothetical protein
MRADNAANTHERASQLRRHANSQYQISRVRALHLMSTAGPPVTQINKADISRLAVSSPEYVT